MPDKQGNYEGAGAKTADQAYKSHPDDIPEGTQPSEKSQDDPGIAHKGGFGEQEAEARPDPSEGVPSAEDVPGR